MSQLSILRIDVTNRLTHREHVLDDLLPYVCVFHGCPKSTEPFETRATWISHVKDLHKANLDSETISQIEIPSSTSLPASTLGQSLSVPSVPVPDLSPYWANSIPSADFPFSIFKSYDNWPHISDYVYQFAKLPPVSDLSSSNFHYYADLPSSSSLQAEPELATWNQPYHSMKGVMLDQCPPYDSVPNPTLTDKQKGEDLRWSMAVWPTPDIYGHHSTDFSGSNAVGPTKTSLPKNPTLRGRIEGDDDRRSFPCILYYYGCTSSFSSKNEWKRHHSIQHIKLGFWRCDLCPATQSLNDPSELYFNDFNRKDLFTQHIRRMHSRPKNMTLPIKPDKEYPVTEENIAEHQLRCHKSIRSPPNRVRCIHCDRAFEGHTGWDEYLEHIARHLEKDRKLDHHSFLPSPQKRDEELERYLLEEGLIARDDAGNWTIGDGKPRRH